MNNSKQDSIDDVAQYIIELAANEYSGISTMKLQKLSYFCQAWALAMVDRPMFDGEFELWSFGPVHRRLHDIYMNIEDRDMTLYNIPHGDSSNLSRNNKVIIDGVANNYGALSGPDLSDIITRKSEEPWNSMRRYYNVPLGKSSTKTIPNDVIQEFYKKDVFV